MAAPVKAFSRWAALLPVAVLPAAPLLLLPEEPEPEVPEPELAAALAAELELPLPLLPLEPEPVVWLPPAVVLEPLPEPVLQTPEPEPVMPAAALLGHWARAALHWLLWAEYHELTALS